jgi:HPt (histidine-containing phosphotransfer) domain-containing protein
MKSATVHEIKKELGTLEAKALVELCLRLAKFKQDNKALLTYLLYESQDEKAFVQGIKAELDEAFAELPVAQLYYFKKGLRRVLRTLNKQIRYSGQAATELELRIYFLNGVRNSGVDLDKSPVLLNLYRQQLRNAHKVMAKLPEDLQFDYQADLQRLE